MFTAMSSGRPPVTLLAALLLSIFLGTALTGCNTLRGAGEDVENAGDAVKDAVD
jgi:predicted small secreted protein